MATAGHLQQQQVTLDISTATRTGSKQQQKGNRNNMDTEEQLQQGCLQRQDLSNCRDARNSSDTKLSNWLAAEMPAVAEIVHFRGYSLKKWQNLLESTRIKGEVYLLNIILQAIKIS